ncbi:MAG: glycosyltransferase family 1 protein [Kiritimatiellia bacterium]
MKIAVDARWIYPYISGIGAYTRELLRYLPVIDGSNSYIGLFDDKSVMARTLRETSLEGRKNFRAVFLPYGPFSLSSQILLPRLLEREAVDVFHSPNYMIPFLAFPRHVPGRIRCVVTIHDLIPLVHPEYTPKAVKTRFHAVYKRVMYESAARADLIIAVSECSRNDIVEKLCDKKTDAGKIRTVYNGVSSFFTPASGQQGAGGAREGLVLYVGRADPYKNLPVLVRAFDMALKRCDRHLALRVVGPGDGRYPEAERLVRKLGLEEAVTWTGYVGDEALLSAYRNADVLVHPSKYEGFGLQVLEAMACGTPVICSRAAALKEVAGDAAILVDSDDAGGFADGIWKVLSDESLALSLRERGMKRASEFKWETAAEKTARIYGEIAER